MTTLTVVGSGDAFNSGGRGHSCYLVRDGAGAYMVDFGATALAGLKRLGVNPDVLDAVLLTHLHGDHCAGLPFLLIDLALRARRERPLTILGPPLVESRVRALGGLCYPGILDQPLPFALRFVALAPPARRRLLGRDVRTRLAYHQKPPEVATCLRVEHGGTTLAFSGDTGWCEGLYAVARGADLLVIECSFDAPADYNRHLAYADIRARAASLGARRILLSHQGPEVRARGRTLEARVGGVALLAADDGRVLRLRP